MDRRISFKCPFGWGADGDERELEFLATGEYLAPALITFWEGERRENSLHLGRGDIASLRDWLIALLAGN